MDARTGLPVVGMVGGGQLARMTHQAAIALGQSLRVLAVSPHDGAALVAADVRIGRHDDLEALRDFAKGCDVVTFDHEHVPGDLIRALAAEGTVLLPGAEALRYAQNKREMRTHLAQLGFPVPRWTAGSVADFAAEVGWPLIVKTATGGYDGRGVFVASSPADVPQGVEVIAEELVDLRRELAAVVARSPFGQVAAYPIVETVQRDGICVEVLVPAPDLDEDLAVEAERIAIEIAVQLDVVGILAVELFETRDGRLLVNELAMRPHNSAHWTIEGARTSQFEQHLRAVLDYPLGDTSLAAPVVVMANVLGGTAGGMRLDERLHHLFAAEPRAKVHLYGKEPRPGRKIGHVTVLGDDLADCRRRAADAARWLTEGETRMPEVTVGVIMGSDSDWPVMSAAAEALHEFGVGHEVRVISAHRTPQLMLDYADAADRRGLKVIIAGAGGAAALPGMVASATPLPVIGVPVPLKYLDGMDSLMSIVQMPAGIPVATVAIGGARNAGLLAVRILAASDPTLVVKMRDFQAALREMVADKDKTLNASRGT